MSVLTVEVELEGLGDRQHTWENCVKQDMEIMNLPVECFGAFTGP